MTEPEKLYTLHELAAIFGLSPKKGRDTIIKWILRGDMPATMIGKQYRVRESQLQEYYEKRSLKMKE